MLLSGLTFVQYFSLVPVYYESEYGLSEDVIGGLLFFKRGYDCNPRNAFGGLVRT